MRNYLEGTETQKQRAYSPAVVTQGGRTVWLAGHTATQDSEGRDISYNFEAQVRQVFRDLDNTLRRAGGTLADPACLHAAAPHVAPVPFLNASGSRAYFCSSL